MLGANTLSSRGAALIYVLGVMAVLGILMSLVWRTIRQNDALVAMDRWDVQARLLATSGLDYALSKIGKGSKQDLSYATDHLVYQLEDPDLAFALVVHTYGLFARAQSTGKTRLPSPGRSKNKFALLGQTLDLAGLPAIGLFNHEGNLVLAGQANVTGKVLLWKGDVRKSNDFKVRWTGSSGHQGAVEDSASKLWEKIRPDFSRAEAWQEKQETCLASHSFEGDDDYTLGTQHDLPYVDSAIIVDTILTECRIMGSSVRVSEGAHLRHCKILAQNIRIERNAELEDVLVYASHNLVLQGETHLNGGQFQARDSLTITLSSPLENAPVFLNYGRWYHRGEKDSAYIGALILNQVQGEGIFLSAIVDKPGNDSKERLIVQAKTDLTGLLYTGGLARMEGTLHGTLLCENLNFEFQGTIYRGHLQNAQLTGFEASKFFFAPLLFPGWPPQSISVNGNHKADSL